MSVRERTWARMYKIEAHSRQGGVCRYCKAPIPVAEATAEHRRPRKLNGLTSAENIDAACFACNNAKRHRTRSQFMRAIHEPDFQRDPWPLYLACMDIRLKLRVAAACRRLRSIIEPKTAEAGVPLQPRRERWIRQSAFRSR